jgi:hypothetical protein
MFPKPRARIFDKRTLWPWRDWMTICIGVLATEKTASDTLILLADTKGSFGDSYSMNRLHKIFKNDAIGLYAAAADHIDHAGELYELISSFMKDHFTAGNYGAFLDSCNAASDMYKRARFRMEILPKYAHKPFSLPEPFDSSHLTPELLKEWQEFYFGCQMVVGAFSPNGQAFMFYIDGYGRADNVSFPGFAAIGSGADNAMFWMSYRNQHLGKSIKHSAYHAFEAKIMAESSPFVNEKLDILVASKAQSILISDFQPKPPQQAPVQLDELRDMFLKFGPQSTDELTPWKVTDEIVSMISQAEDQKSKKTPSARRDLRRLNSSRNPLKEY